MLRGVIVAESLRLDAVIEGPPLVVRKFERVAAGLDDQPPHWTLIWFEAADADRPRLADALSAALGTPIWLVRGLSFGYRGHGGVRWADIPVPAG